MSKKGKNNPEQEVKAEAQPEKTEFVNPYQRGVTYQHFLEALGEKSVLDYLVGKEKSPGVEFSAEDIEWLTQEIENYKNKIITK